MEVSIDELRLEPTYNHFPDIPWEIGMAMVETYREMREKPYYTDEVALKNASVIYNSQRHEFLWGIYGLRTDDGSRAFAEKRRLAYERKRLRELAEE